MLIEPYSSSGLQASEYAAVEQLVFARHSSRNEDETNPEFLCSLFHSLFTMRTEQIPEHHNGSALDSGTEPAKIVAGDKRARPSIGVVGKDRFATSDGRLQSGIFAVAPLAMFRFALPQNLQGDFPPGCIDADDCGQVLLAVFLEQALHPISPDVRNRGHLMIN
jgi:hypothetical protein